MCYTKIVIYNGKENVYNGGKYPCMGDWLYFKLMFKNAGTLIKTAPGHTEEYDRLLDAVNTMNDLYPILLPWFAGNRRGCHQRLCDSIKQRVVSWGRGWGFKRTHLAPGRRDAKRVHTNKDIERREVRFNPGYFCDVNGRWR